VAHLNISSNYATINDQGASMVHKHDLCTITCAEWTCAFTNSVYK
jgi:hypothetical protein